MRPLIAALAPSTSRSTPSPPHSNVVFTRWASPSRAQDASSLPKPDVSPRVSLARPYTSISSLFILPPPTPSHSPPLPPSLGTSSASSTQHQSSVDPALRLDSLCASPSPHLKYFLLFSSPKLCAASIPVSQTGSLFSVLNNDVEEIEQTRRGGTERRRHSSSSGFRFFTFNSFHPSRHTFLYWLSSSGRCHCSRSLNRPSAASVSGTHVVYAEQN